MHWCCSSLAESNAVSSNGSKLASPIPLEQVPAIGSPGQPEYLVSPEKQKFTSSADDEVKPVQAQRTVESKLQLSSATVGQFIVTVEKNASDPNGLGLDVDITDGPTLLIDAVQDGLVKSWNAKHPGSEVMPRDRFLEVNGIRGDAKLIIDELSKAQALSIVVRRPIEFAVSIKKPNEQSRLGLELSYCAGGATLLVKMINPGLVDSWNKEHPACSLERGDRVVEVNGTAGNSKELFELLTTRDSVELKCIKALQM